MIIKHDFLIIGSGIAGLSLALKLSKYGTVAVITKKEKAESNTNYAQGGIAAVVDPEDSTASHYNDTMKTGGGLSDSNAVKLLVEDAFERINELIEWGAQFTMKDTDSSAPQFDLGREGGHSKHRIIHAKDLTGREVERALLSSTKSNERITIYEEHFAVELITEHHIKSSADYSQDNIHCWGAYVLNTPENKIDIFLSRFTILGTGGCGRIYLHSTNPSIATGDGLAMAFRAGAVVSNLEFMQFHPTTLYHPEANSFLISEAVRGYGAILKTKDGNPFMDRYHKMGSLAPRDVVAKAIDTELKKRGEECVYLDIRHKDAASTIDHFPHIYNKCLSYNIDITKQPIPVVPAAHYMCGGVVTDLDGKTSIASLYACGEVACTGVHGANRLASNSLLEAIVFSNQIYKNIITQMEISREIMIPDVPEWCDEGTFNQEEWILISHDREEIQSIMWDYVGIVRSNLRLKRAMRRINLINEEIERYYKKTKISDSLLELRNIGLNAKLIISCALHRKESRGLHYTTDYPKADDINWKRNTLLKRQSGFIKFFTKDEV